MAAPAHIDRLLARGLRQNLGEVLMWSWPLPATTGAYGLQHSGWTETVDWPAWLPWLPIVLLSVALPAAKMAPLAQEALAERDARAMVALTAITLAVGTHTSFWCLIAFWPSGRFAYRFIPLWVLASPAVLLSLGFAWHERRNTALGAALLALLPLSLGLQLVALPLRLDGVVSWSWGMVLLPATILLSVAVAVAVGASIAASAREPEADVLVFGSSAALGLAGVLGSLIMVSADSHTTPFENALPILASWTTLLLAWVAVRLYFLGVAVQDCFARIQHRQASLQASVEEREARSVLRKDGLPPAAPAAETPAGPGPGEYQSLVDDAEAAEVEASVNDALSAISAAAHPSELLPALGELLGVLQAQPLHRIRPLKQSVIAVCNWRRRELGSLWTPDVARRYGRVLREFSGVQRAASHFLGLQRAPSGASPSRRYAPPRVYGSLV